MLNLEGCFDNFLEEFNLHGDKDSLLASYQGVHAGLAEAFFIKKNLDETEFEWNSMSHSEKLAMKQELDKQWLDWLTEYAKKLEEE